MLQDYPELLLEIQDGLNRIVNEMVGHGNVTPPFERAIWRLDDTLERLADKARDELKAAEANDVPEVIEQARKKEFSIGRASSYSPWTDLHGEQGLWEYFRIYREAFE